MRGKRSIIGCLLLAIVMSQAAWLLPAGKVRADGDYVFLSPAGYTLYGYIHDPDQDSSIGKDEVNTGLPTWPCELKKPDNPVDAATCGDVFVKGFNFMLALTPPAAPGPLIKTYTTQGGWYNFGRDRQEQVRKQWEEIIGDLVKLNNDLKFHQTAKDYQYYKVSGDKLTFTDDGNALWNEIMEDREGKSGDTGSLKNSINYLVPLLYKLYTILNTPKPPPDTGNWRSDLGQLGGGDNTDYQVKAPSKFADVLKLPGTEDSSTLINQLSFSKPYISMREFAADYSAFYSLSKDSLNDKPASDILASLTALGAGIRIDGGLVRNQGADPCGNSGGVSNIGSIIPYAFCGLVLFFHDTVQILLTNAASLLAVTADMLPRTIPRNVTASTRDQPSNPNDTFIGTIFEGKALDALSHPIEDEVANTDPKSFGVVIRDAYDRVLQFLNVFLIFAFIVIALLNILQVQVNTYAIKKVLPGLIIGFVVAHMSFFAIRAALEVTGQITKGIFQIGTDNVNGFQGFVDAFSGVPQKFTDAVGGCSDPIYMTNKCGDAASGVSLGKMFQVLLSSSTAAVAAVFLFILGFLLLARRFIFYALIPLAPLAFFGLFFAPAETIWKRWWKLLQGWLLMPLIAGFWIWLAMLWFKAAGASGAGAFWAPILSYIFGIIALGLAIRTPFQLAGEAKAVLDKWNGLGKSAWKNTGGALGEEAKARVALSPLGDASRALKARGEERKLRLEAAGKGQNLGAARKEQLLSEDRTAKQNKKEAAEQKLQRLKNLQGVDVNAMSDDDKAFWMANQNKADQFREEAEQAAKDVARLDRRLEDRSGILGIKGNRARAQKQVLQQKHLALNKSALERVNALAEERLSKESKELSEGVLTWMERRRTGAYHELEDSLTTSSEEAKAAAENLKRNNYTYYAKGLSETAHLSNLEKARTNVTGRIAGIKKQLDRITELEQKGDQRTDAEQNELVSLHTRKDSLDARLTKMNGRLESYKSQEQSPKFQDAKLRQEVLARHRVEHKVLSTVITALSEDDVKASERSYYQQVLHSGTGSKSTDSEFDQAVHKKAQQLMNIDIKKRADDLDGYPINDLVFKKDGEDQLHEKEAMEAIFLGKVPKSFDASFSGKVRNKAADFRTSYQELNARNSVNTLSIYAKTMKRSYELLTGEQLPVNDPINALIGLPDQKDDRGQAKSFTAGEKEKFIDQFRRGSAVHKLFGGIMESKIANRLFNPEEAQRVTSEADRERVEAINRVNQPDNPAPGPGTTQASQGQAQGESPTFPDLN